VQDVSPLGGGTGVLDSPGEEDEGRGGQTEEEYQKNQNPRQQSMIVSDSPLDHTPQQPHRQRSSTLGALTGDKIRYEIRNRRTSQSNNLNASPYSPAVPSRTIANNNGLTGSAASPKPSPMMNL
jgi:hypothetical protein